MGVGGIGGNSRRSGETGARVFWRWRRIVRGWGRGLVALCGHWRRRERVPLGPVNPQCSSPTPSAQQARTLHLNHARRDRRRDGTGWHSGMDLARQVRQVTRTWVAWIVLI